MYTLLNEHICAKKSYLKLEFEIYLSFENYSCAFCMFSQKISIEPIYRNIPEMYGKLFVYAKLVRVMQKLLVSNK